MTTYQTRSPFLRRAWRVLRYTRLGFVVACAACLVVGALPMLWRQL